VLLGRIFFVFSFVFLEELKTPKSPFEINLPLATKNEVGDFFQIFWAFSDYLNFK
jgi:hypothetical protein